MLSDGFWKGILRSNLAYRYRFDDVQVDLQSFRLLKAGQIVPVEPKVLNLLIFLVENRGRLVQRRELIDAVWGDAFVTDHVLNYSIGQLRKGLADDAKNPKYIETVPTLGYRFIADVEVEEPEVAKGTEPTRPTEGVPTSSKTVLKYDRRGVVASAIALVIGLTIGG